MWRLKSATYRNIKKLWSMRKRMLPELSYMQDFFRGHMHVLRCKKTSKLRYKGQRLEIMWQPMKI